MKTLVSVTGVLLMLAGCGCPEGQQAVRTYVTGMNGRAQEHYQCMTTFRAPDFSGDVKELHEGFRRRLENLRLPQNDK